MIVDLDQYDGHLLHNRFAFRYFGNKVLPTGNIIAFRGSMEVLADAMIDQEDLIAKAFIWSDDAINFLWEIPLLGQDAFAAVTFQRLFNTHIADILATYLEKQTSMKGDDIMVHDNTFPDELGKCSVSITHVKNGATLGHTGINIRAGDKAPSHAYSTGLTNEQAEEFMQDVIAMYHSLTQDIFVATCKTIST